MKRDLTDQLDKERRANSEKVKDLLTDFKQDMQTVESTHKRKQNDTGALSTKLESKVQKQ